MPAQRSGASLLSRGELVCIDIAGDALGEGDPRGLVTDLVHVPPRLRGIARHHMQVGPGTVRLFGFHRDAPNQPADVAPSVITSGNEVDGRGRRTRRLSGPQLRADPSRDQRYAGIVDFTV